MAAGGRNRRRAAGSTADFISYVNVLGETGAEDALVLTRLVDHAIAKINVRRATRGQPALDLHPAEDLRQPKLGEFLAEEAGPGAAQLRIKLLLRDQAEVDDLRRALHNSHVRVGTELFFSR